MKRRGKGKGRKWADLYSENLIIEIDPELYERVAILGMKMGRDDVIELINDMLEYECMK